MGQNFKLVLCTMSIFAALIKTVATSCFKILDGIMKWFGLRTIQRDEKGQEYFTLHPLLAQKPLLFPSSSPAELDFLGQLPKTYHASLVLSLNPQSIRRDKDFAHTHLMPDPLEANLSHFGSTARCPLTQTHHEACCTPVKYPPHPPQRPGLLMLKCG